MTQKDIENRILAIYPFVFRNNRGGMTSINGNYFTYGIPQPPHGRKERDNEPKGSDYIGFIMVEDKPIFAAIEIKTLKDKLLPGQIKWLKFVYEHNGVAELWKETEDGVIVLRGALIWETNKKSD